ncbi:unnamed protein product [Cunninghamella blakesleeana]
MSTLMSTSTACYEPINNSYQTAFPALQALPLSYPLPSQSSRKRRTSNVSNLLQQSLTPPKPPPYLKHTHYAELVREQYQYKLHKRYDTLSTTSTTSKNGNDPNHHSLSNNHSLNKKQDDAMISIEDHSNEILNDLDLRLPTFWSKADKSNYLEIDKNGLEVKYIGPGKQEEHAGTVRSNFPMRPQCGIYYFEIYVKSKGDDGYIGIGFCSEKNKLNRLPGWDELSFGYHGDDGNSFKSSGTGTEYGPQFGTGDTVGCCVNFANQTAFFTKNGASLGTAFTQLDFSTTYYPCVGMQTCGECITVNFGQEPFAFDITQYIKEQKMTIWKEFQSYNIPQNDAIHQLQKPKMIKKKPKDDTGNSIHQLIHSYLVHHGYTNTANALRKDINHTSSPKKITSKVAVTEDETLENDISMHWVDEGIFYQRIDIKSSIDHGNIDQATKLLQLYFPKLLNDNGNGTYINFRLKCQTFVEMIREYSINEQKRRNSIKSIKSDHQQPMNETITDNLISIKSENDLSSPSLNHHHHYFHDHDDLKPQQQQHHHHLSNLKQQQSFIHPLSNHLNDDHEEKTNSYSPPNINNTLINNQHYHHHPYHHPIDHHHHQNNNRRKSVSIQSHNGPPNSFTLNSTAQGKRKSWAEIAASSSNNQNNNHNNHNNNNNNNHLETNSTMEFNGPIRPSSSYTRRSSSFRRGSNGGSSIYSACSVLTNHDLALDEEDESSLKEDCSVSISSISSDDDSSIASMQYMQNIMDYGQLLRDTYGKEQNPLYKEKLKQIFSLLAYPDPYSSPVGHLLDSSSREELSSYINSAILVCQNQPDTPALDRIYRQVVTINKELTFAGHGKSTLLDFPQDQEGL